jgi:hypothetical protein
MAGPAIDVGDRDKVVPFPSGRAGQDDVENARSRSAADKLRDDVGDRFSDLEAPCRNEATGHRGIEMRPGDVAHGIGHRENGRHL